MSRIVVLGANGFVGSNIAAFYAAAHKEVWALDSKSCDLLEKEESQRVLSALLPNDRVVMCAAITRLRANDMESMNQNIAMVQNLLRALEKKRVKHLLYFSSIDVYGIDTASEPITEESPLAPDDFYATAKTACEYMLRTFCKNYGIKLTIVRTSGIFGQGDYTNSTVAKMAARVLQSGTLTITGDGALKRDYLYIDDMLQALEMLIEHEAEGVYNLSSGESVTILELAQGLFKIVGIEPKIEFIAPNSSRRAGDLHFDISKLRAAIPQFRPKPLHQNLQSYLAHLRSHYEK